MLTVFAERSGRGQIHPGHPECLAEPGGVQDGISVVQTAEGAF